MHGSDRKRTPAPIIFATPLNGNAVSPVKVGIRNQVEADLLPPQPLPPQPLPPGGSPLPNEDLPNPGPAEVPPAPQPDLPPSQVPPSMG